jgi:hypothetical protein
VSLMCFGGSLSVWMRYRSQIESYRKAGFKLPKASIYLNTTHMADIMNWLDILGYDH